MNSSVRHQFIRIGLTISVFLGGFLFIVLYDGVGEQTPSGGELYVQHCGNCHGKEGQGFRSMYPPLADSDYLREHQDDLACIIFYGMEDSIHVNGKPYSQKMWGLPHLHAHEVASIIHFVCDAWAKPIDKPDYKQVKAQIDRCPQAPPRKMR